MDFMDEINQETQAYLKKLTAIKIEKKANAKKRIAELEQLIKLWEEENE
tara:strand:+ start:535 stop:681 length:147 start_codon:yes stop_codon:yes gene_type:complete